MCIREKRQRPCLAPLLSTRFCTKISGSSVKWETSRPRLTSALAWSFTNRVTSDKQCKTHFSHPCPRPYLPTVTMPPQVLLPFEVELRKAEMKLFRVRQEGPRARAVRWGGVWALVGWGAAGAQRYRRGALDREWHVWHPQGLLLLPSLGTPWWASTTRERRSEICQMKNKWSFSHQPLNMSAAETCWKTSLPTSFT
jgi:hypothetical protein